MNNGNKVLTKKLMAKRLTGKCGLTYAKGMEVLEDLFSAFSEALTNGHSVSMKNVGTLKVKVVPARELKLKHCTRLVPTRRRVKFIQSTRLVVEMPVEDVKKPFKK